MIVTRTTSTYERRQYALVGWNVTRERRDKYSASVDDDAVVLWRLNRSTGSYLEGQGLTTVLSLVATQPSHQARKHVNPRTISQIARATIFINARSVAKVTNCRRFITSSSSACSVNEFSV